MPDGFLLGNGVPFPIFPPMSDAPAAPPVSAGGPSSPPARPASTDRPAKDAGTTESPASGDPKTR